ncbi:MAG: hypothetical protein ACI915_001273 [Gammaproteobacteria bacterium]|jgi:hypothetical protein
MRIRPMPRRQSLARIAMVIAITLANVSCGSYTFKRGASPGDMAADESACRGTEQVFHECMRKRGWFIASNLSDLKPADPGIEQPTIMPAQDTSAAQAATKSVNQVAGESKSERPPSRTGSKSVPTADVPKVVDPLTPLAVSSWWKFGGNAGGLEQDIAACVAELGNAHRPQPAATIVTQGMHACLKEHRWFAIGK